MKAFLLTMVTALSALAALGQGMVDFFNDSVTLSSPPDRLIRFDTNGVFFPPAFGTNFQVQLYYGASTAVESSLTPLSAAPATLRPSSSVSLGTWQGGDRRVFQNAGPGQTLLLQVRVWDISFGGTYEQAYPYVAGKSAPFLYTVPQLFDPPSAFSMNNFTGFKIVPEPSAAVLSVLGALLLVRGVRRRGS